MAPQNDDVRPRRNTEEVEVEAGRKLASPLPGEEVVISGKH